MLLAHAQRSEERLCHQEPPDGCAYGRSDKPRVRSACTKEGSQRERPSRGGPTELLFGGQSVGRTENSGTMRKNSASGSYGSQDNSRDG